jgi:hypothetical protein
MFSKPPKPSSSSKPVHNEGLSTDSLSGHVSLFKRTYVLERRVLDMCRAEGDSPVYKPAASLDGGKRYNTPEEKSKQNSWEAAYLAVAAICKPDTPIEYVRILFNSLRYSSLPTPNVLQLASASNAQIVRDYAKDAFKRLQSSFITDSARAKTEILLRLGGKAGTRQATFTAIYCTLLDARLGLSPLYRYCLATDALQKAQDERKAGVNMDFGISRMQTYVKDLEFLAAFDYTVFPEIYSSVYGSSLPSGFKKLALSLVDSARDA